MCGQVGMEQDTSLQVDERDPWEQLPDEPRMWYERFEIYRLLGPLRTMGLAYRKYRAVSGTPSNTTMVGQWSKYAKKYEWDRRAQAWDDSLREEREVEAMEVYSEGLSMAHERVRKLKAVAQKLEDYILDPRTTRISPHVIEQYRGLLDDIAKERGERKNVTAITGADGGPIRIVTSWGRGGSASDAWNALPEPVIDGEIKEITEENHAVSD